ncbi:MAG: hypothetical protein Q6M54_03385 [Thermostichus sp. DRC_bins_24]
MGKAFRWVWGLGACLWLWGFGSLEVQAQSTPGLGAAPNGIRSPELNGLNERDPGRPSSSPAALEPDPDPTNLPLPGRLPRLTTPMARPQTPAPERWRPVLPGAEAELFPFSRFPLLKKLDPPPPTLAELGIHLERLALLPDADLAEEMNVEFSQQLARLNAQIADKQERLYRLLQDWDSAETDIRQIQAQLSELRTERDRLALEHLLMLRQLQDNFALPLPSRSAAGSP